MNFNESQLVESHTLKQQLIPNFHLLDHAVQKQLVNVLETLISNPTKKMIQQFSKLGLLEEAPPLRAHIWKLLLQTINLDPTTWKITKHNNHELYRTLVEKFIGSYVDEQDLLGINNDRNFDMVLWGEIELDTKRTHSALNFFQKDIEHTKIYANKKTKNSDILSRILYIWGKINPTIRYVQGMNQILAPIYYLQFQKFTIYSESQVFIMFSSLMTFLLDMHIKDMDQSQQGIMGRMLTLNKYLKVVDYQLWLKLQNEKIVPHYYSFRWLALLLAQQFGLYETMKLWDNLLAFDGYKRYFYLYCCCISILKYKKQLILSHDFIVILPAIQKLRDVDVTKIIQIANKLYDKYSKVNIDKIYKQLNKEIEQRQKNLEEGFADTKNNNAKNKWNYGDMLKNTGTFFSKFLPAQIKK